MGWDDIDFTTIVVGAVTVDVNSDQNFYDVLNMFGIALDEKVNVVTTSQDALPTLPDIRFDVAGEIRADITFMEKYRALLDGYFDIWNDFDWYSPAALLDPLNFGDYLLGDDDLEFVMGENAFDLLTDRGNKNRIELWSADLLNGLYELYKLTQVTVKSLLSRVSPDTTLYNHPMFWTSDDVVRLSRTGFADTAETTYADIKAEYIASQAIFIHAVGTPFNPKMIFYSQGVTGSAVGGGAGGDRWGFGASSTDSFVVTMKVLDLEGNDVKLDIVGTGMQVFENYTKTTQPLNAPPAFATPEAGFPFVGPNDAPITVALAANSVTLDTPLGYRNNYFLYGTPDAQVFPPIVDPPADLFADLRFELEFDIAMHVDFVIDVNSSDLEFFIAP